MEDFTKPFQEAASSSKEYFDLRTDELKLRTAEGLSLAFSKFTYMMLFMTVLTIVLISLAFGSVLLIGDLIGSYAAGAFIVGGVFLILLMVLYLLRNRLFRNTFVKLFVRIFYGEK